MNSLQGDGGVARVVGPLHTGGASSIARCRAVNLSAYLMAMLMVLAGGCSASNGPPPDDEAMVRAKRAGMTPEQAALNYRAPRKNYFPAMDTVGRPAAPDEDWPDQLVDRAAESPVRGEDPRPAIGMRPRREVSPFQLTTEEAIGRNTWMIWCAGNEGFWDWLANNSFGGSDLLKVLDSRNRATLFRDAGLINEPEMASPGVAEPTDFGVRLSVPADPQRRSERSSYLSRVFDRQQAEGYDATKAYDNPPGPDGYRYGEGYDKDGRVPTPPPEIYGLSSGVIGLRLFPNPKFDKAARAKWDPDRYYNDPDYYSNPELIRPFRVGMSCAFCHASFHPLKPPRDITDPEWANISGNTGAQYLRIRGVFANLLTPESFVYHVLDSQPPGTIDTSLIPSDNINNTNTMNSIFGLPSRVAVSIENPKERLDPSPSSLPSVWADSEVGTSETYKRYVEVLPDLSHANENPRRVPRILFDGADSIGAFGALARVYLNIGSYWEQWIRIHRPLVGFQPQEPFKIDDCEAHSVYWIATQARVGPMRDYFLRVTPPMRLLDVPGDVDRTAEIDERALEARAESDKLDYQSLLAREKARRIDVRRLKNGRQVFAKNCIVCHSSIQPRPRREEMDDFARKGEFWDHDPGRWLADEEYRKWATEIVETPEFWLNNFLSTDYRIPVNYVGTNSARAMATNAMSGHMWQDFSSADYQKMPSVGSIPFFNPYKSENGGMDSYSPQHKVPAGVPEGGGGPGFYRVPTLISIWAGAPLLHNNSLGLFNNDPSVDGRLMAFDDAIRKLLSPEKRLQSSSYNEATPERLARDRGLIWRTPVESYLSIPARHVPYLATNNLAALMHFVERFPWLRSPRLKWVPAAFVVLGAVGLLRSKSFKRRVWTGYIPLAAALTTAVITSFFLGRVGDVRIGPIPKGTPVNLLANLNPEAAKEDVLDAIAKTTAAMGRIRDRGLSDEEARRHMALEVAPALLKVSKCPDFVMDKGHDFPWFKTMTEADKDDLIELLKTF